MQFDEEIDVDEKLIARRAGNQLCDSGKAEGRYETRLASSWVDLATARAVSTLPVRVR